MPITGQGWELHVVRKTTHSRSVGTSRIRTVGTYQVFHDGTAQTGPGLAGTMAESKGPGKNAPAGNGRRIEEGRYPLSTQNGAHYKTWTMNLRKTSARIRNLVFLFWIRTSGLAYWFTLEKIHSCHQLDVLILARPWRMPA